MTQFDLTSAQQAAGIDRVAENIALRSGAGCGKTFVLARRFTELLMSCEDQNDPMAGFVALTFTDKAAAEMSQRVRKILRNFADTTTNPDERKKFLTWLDKVPEARISTIHGFCASLLRSCAIEAAIDPNFSVCSETLVVDELLLEACESAVLSALEKSSDAPDRPFVEKISELFTSCKFNQVVGYVRYLVKNRSRIDFEKYLDPDATFKRWSEIIEAQRIEAGQKLITDETIGNALGYLRQQHCSDTSDKLYPGFVRTVAIAKSILAQPLEQSQGLFDELGGIKPGSKGKAENWGGKDKPKFIRDTINELRDALAGYALLSRSLDESDKLAAGVLATFTRLAIDANEIYLKTKLSRGMVDFTDLLVLARDVIKTNPTIRAGLAGDIRQVLIDEAQDTDATQLELLWDIISASSDGSLSEIPNGKLFLVGDPNQSIYRFRGAQKQVFDDLCSQIPRSQHINLDVSFRTHIPGVGFVNHLFSKLFDDSYVPISSNRSDIPDWATVEIILADSGEDAPLKTVSDCSTAQAALTVQRIEEMLTNGQRCVWDEEKKHWREVKPGDIAILFAKMPPAIKYERQLQKRNIPYYVVGGTGFFRRQEIYNLLNAIGTIDNPADDIAFFGLLRSELVGLDDNALMHIARTLNPPYLMNLDDEAFAKLSTVLSDTQLTQLRFASDLIRGLNRRKNSLGIDELLTVVLDETGYEATLLGQFQGKRMLGNVHVLLEKARSVGGEISLSEFISQIRKRILSESRHEQAAVSGEDENVVRLMTIHKAKGLEFPVVFIPELNTGRESFREQLFDLYRWGLTTKILPQRDDDELPLPLSFALAKEAEQRAEDSELIRKYYVALTRHKDHLVLVGANFRDKDGYLKSKGSFLQLLDEQLNFTNAIDAGESNISYSDGGRDFEISLRCEVPKAPSVKKSPIPAGRLLLDKSETSAEFISEMRELIGDTAKKTSPPALMGIVPLGSGNVELAVTALNEFEQCPMLYRWRYELRGGRLDDNRKKRVEQSSPGTCALDPLTLGTFLHRCMELLNFQNPQSSDELVTRVAGEMNMDAAEVGGISARFESILQIFAGHELSGTLREISPDDIYRELDFVSDYGSVQLRGQIDMLYRNENKWYVLDYKSDHVDEAKITQKAARYELQMLIYAAAAEKLTGVLPDRATLYFLRTGATHTFEITRSTINAARTRITDLAERLIRARRTGNFTGCKRPTCDFCRHLFQSMLDA